MFRGAGVPERGRDDLRLATAGLSTTDCSGGGLVSGDLGTATSSSRLRFQPFNLLLITRNLIGILAKPGLLLTQHDLKLFNIIRKLSSHTPTL